MQTVMFQFYSATEPTLAEVAQRFGLGLSQLDAQFGVIATSRAEGLFTVLVAASEYTRLSGQPSSPGEGAFSNPRIEPFGPPE